MRKEIVFQLQIFSSNTKKRFSDTHEKVSVAAAAWLETLVEIAAHIPVQSVTDLVGVFVVANRKSRIPRTLNTGANPLRAGLATPLSPRDAHNAAQVQRQQCVIQKATDQRRRSGVVC